MEDLASRDGSTEDRAVSLFDLPLIKKCGQVSGVFTPGRFKN